MKKEKPLILISNDDGINAKGINELVKAIKGLGEIIVVAPDGPRSGFACAITSESPIRYYSVKEEKELKIYKCTGTPVDCIKLALHTIVNRKPDIIIGGINHGDNSSVNVHYSGTMGIVIEGCLKGIPSVGFSLCDHSANADFTPMFPYIRNIINNVLINGLHSGVCLNVNFPNIKEFKGVKICHQTKGVWTKEWIECNHPRGGNYYWLTGEYKNLEQDNIDTDHWAMSNGYVAITPTKIDVTAYEVIDELEKWNFKV